MPRTTFTRISRLNTLRHGLTGHISIMTDEERTAHAAFTGPILKRLAPEGPVEAQYAQLIAQDHWASQPPRLRPRAFSRSAKATPPPVTREMQLLTL